jgi:hypothetical protein
MEKNINKQCRRGGGGLIHITSTTVSSSIDTYLGPGYIPPAVGYTPKILIILFPCEIPVEARPPLGPKSLNNLTMAAAGKNGPIVSHLSYLAALNH